MSDYFEIDFLNVGNGKSGDAIPIRYNISNSTRIHVVDGGFQETGENLVDHINKYYDSPSHIDAVVLTHPDGDHAGGLKILFEKFEINELWMLRPWLYADELIDRFSRFSSVENLRKRLKELYPNIVKLEELAEEYSVSILEPFQGAQIGEFTVLAPSKSRYLDLLIESEKTPEATKEAQKSLLEAAGEIIKKALALIRSAWGEEIFPEEDTSPENNMSVVQYANLCEQKILLTGDAGRAALSEAIEYAPTIDLILPGMDEYRFLITDLGIMFLQKFWIVYSALNLTLNQKVSLQLLVQQKKIKITLEKLSFEHLYIVAQRLLQQKGILY